MLLEEVPHHAEAWAWRGAIYDMLNYKAQAVQYYERALDLRPDHDICRLHLVFLLQHANRVGQAHEHLQLLYERQPDNPEVLVGLARYYLGIAHHERAGRLLARALAHQPNHVQGLAEQAKLYFLEKKYSEAEICLRRALLVEPSERSVNYLLYQCFKKAGKKAAARAQHDKFKQLEKDLGRIGEILRYDLAKDLRNPDLFCELGRIFMRHSQPDRGLYWFHHALTLNPKHRSTHRALAAFFEHIGKKEFAAMYRAKMKGIAGGRP
jgi:tetratricopeptide (TPR) repeat protein